MADCVLDASAILAVLLGEPGGEVARRRIATGLVSAVNYAEVVAKLIDRGTPAASAVVAAEELAMEVVAVDATLGLRIGTLHADTRGGNISLGDRACLALAEREGLPAVTADRAWAALDLGIEVVLIR